MLEKGKIDARQLTILIITAILPTAILTIPPAIIGMAKQDSWISTILSTFVGLMLVWLTTSLSLRFTGKTLFEFSEEILGKVLGKIINFSYFVWFIHTNVLIIKELGGFVNATILLNTPIYVSFIVSVAVAAYAIYNGLEVLARFSQMFMPIILLLLVSILVLSMQNMNIYNILPILDTEPATILKATAVPSSWMGEIILFTMIIPYMRRPEESTRAGISAMLVIGFYSLLSVFVSITVLGPHIANNLVFPTFNAVRMISIANFLERLESITITAWIIANFIKIGIFYYAAVLGGAQLFGLKDYKTLILPIGIVMIILSVLLLPSNIELIDFILRYYVLYALIFFQIGIPLMLLAVALIRKKGGKSCG